MERVADQPITRTPIVLGVEGDLSRSQKGQWCGKNVAYWRPS